ncbi:RNI-like protein [Suhomyces tanzawaensis NRRL Y-17324]|uniref:RNI-like protein n=1 Tax=Suhomyces tanzawaensis NRRL Y-17324 TaxID=984487 RepID=A0A1E4SCV2_9ASCO|nr:RNI-like protein [Suhomyces tanzawaensis NRRL Y-17324]ODV77296.1 RNI-like protein [Suhomyces tanzawaensis NRRL Y-17324]
MSRNRKSSGVRGPNSALTEFLKNEGITEGFRRRREAQASESPHPQQERSTEPENEDISEDPEETVSPAGARIRRGVATESDQEEEAIRAAGRAKRRDDSDFDPEFSDDDLDANGIKKFGEEDNCVTCGKVFNLTVYSRYLRDQRGYVCETCNETIKAKERNAKRNQMSSRKKRKKIALALLDKQVVRIPKLQDICIKKITLNIDDVEALGDIGQVNMNKISKILSKNRSLNNSTVSLFLNPNLKSLEFWDCSNVDSDSLNRIASYCPNLESLTLFMCGQLHNDNLKYYTTNLKSLSELSLNGPFLISDTVWQEYFEQSGSQLTKFEVRNTHRFQNDSLISLLENSGRNLTSLRLSRLDGLDSKDVYDLIPHYLEPSKLEQLEISYPFQEDLVTDDLLINILAITGETITHLNLDGCSNLTDQFITDGLAKFCPNLTHLSMKNLDQITNEAFARALEEYSAVNSGGLISVDLTKCTGLGDEAIYSLLKHSGHTVVEFSINSLSLLSKDFLLQLFTEDHHPYKKGLKEKLEKLESNGTNENNEENDNNETPSYYPKLSFPFLTTADFGFVRSVDDEILELVGESCPKLSILEVYGNNRCTFRANFRKDLMVIGRQGDEV